MRAKTDAKAFIQALDKVSDLIRKSTIPALTAVLVRFEGDSCTLTSTNLDSFLSMKLPAHGDEFSFLLGRPKETARAFRQFDGELALEQTETGEGAKRQIKLALSCGSRSAELFPFLPEDFPEQQQWEPKHTFTANAAQLYHRVERVKYAAGAPDQADFRVCRSCVQFSCDRIYTVDGYRLSCDTDPGLTVPVPFMAFPGAFAHLKLFGDQDVTFRLGERYALATNGVVTLTFRLPEGDLFNLSRAIPSIFQVEFEVCPKSFLNELDYLERALRGKGPHLVRFSNGKLSASSQGESYAAQVQTNGDANVTFGFRLAYMVDALKQFEKEPTVRMKLVSPSGALIIETNGRKDFAMVMLVQLRDSMAA